MRSSLRHVTKNRPGIDHRPGPRVGARGGRKRPDPVCGEAVKTRGRNFEPKAPRRRAALLPAPWACPNGTRATREPSARQCGNLKDQRWPGRVRRASQRRGLLGAMRLALGVR